MTKQELIQLVDSNIYTNGNKEITGAKLNNVLKSLIENCYGSERKVIFSNGYQIASTYSEGAITDSGLTKAELGQVFGLTEDGVDYLFSKAPDKVYAMSYYLPEIYFSRLTLSSNYTKRVDGTSYELEYEDAENQLGYIEPSLDDCNAVTLQYQGDLAWDAHTYNYVVQLALDTDGTYRYNISQYSEMA